jgi:hypothetical protein
VVIRRDEPAFAAEANRGRGIGDRQVLLPRAKNMITFDQLKKFFAEGPIFAA